MDQRISGPLATEGSKPHWSHAQRGTEINIRAVRLCPHEVQGSRTVLLTSRNLYHRICYPRSVDMDVEEKLVANESGCSRRSILVPPSGKPRGVLGGWRFSSGIKPRASMRHLSRCFIRAKHSPQRAPSATANAPLSPSTHVPVGSRQIDTRSGKTPRKLLQTISEPPAKSLHFPRGAKYVFAGHASLFTAHHLPLPTRNSHSSRNHRKSLKTLTGGMFYPERPGAALPGVKLTTGAMR